jgi:hypothetical protein
MKTTTIKRNNPHGFNQYKAKGYESNGLIEVVAVWFGLVWCMSHPVDVSRFLTNAFNYINVII